MTCEQAGQADPSEEKYLDATIDHIANTFDINPQLLIDHIDNVQEIYRSAREKGDIETCEALDEIDREHDVLLYDLRNEDERE